VRYQKSLKKVFLRNNEIIIEFETILWYYEKNKSEPKYEDRRRYYARGIQGY